MGSRFTLTVVRGQEPPTAIVVDAASVAEARRAAHAEGWSVLSAGPYRTGLLRPGSPSRSSSLDHRVFCAQLASLLQAGLGVVESIRALRDDADPGATRDRLADLIAELEKGRTLGAAMSKSPGTFPPLLSAMVSAAERTSNLPDAIRRYGQYAVQLDSIRNAVRAAAVYPLFLLLLGGAVVLFLLLYVVPRFAKVYDSVRGELPWAATLLLEWGRFVTEHGIALYAVIATVMLGTGFTAGHPASRGQALRVVAQAPAVGRVLRHIALARLYRTLAILLDAGMSLSAALAASSGLFSRATDTSIGHAAALISQGRSPSDALGQADLTTPLTRSLIAAGEGSGQLARMLDEAARFVEEDGSREIDRTMRLIEPVLMAAIGLVVGVIVVLMYLPIFELAGSLR